MKKITIFILALILVLSVAGKGRATSSQVPMSGVGSGTLKDLVGFDGFITYGHDFPNELEFRLRLIGTPPPFTMGGFLTAIAFNNPFNDITGLEIKYFKYSRIGTDELHDAGPAWHVIPLTGPFNNKDIDGSPSGHFDIGLSITDNFLGDGTTEGAIPIYPNEGVFAGTSIQLILSLSGNNLDDLTAQDFAGALSAGGGEFRTYFVARLQGFTTPPGASDTLIGQPIVPLPSTLLLFSSGLLGLAGWRRLRRS